METLKEEEEELKKKVELCKVSAHVGIPGCVGLAGLSTALVSHMRKLKLVE